MLLKATGCGYRYFRGRNKLLIFRSPLIFLLSLFIISGQACAANMRIIPVAKGWAKSEVNAVIFRQHPLTTFGNEQYIAFYGEDSSVILARRKLADLKWDIMKIFSTFFYRKSTMAAVTCPLKWFLFWSGSRNEYPSAHLLRKSTSYLSLTIF